MRTRRLLSPSLSSAPSGGEGARRAGEEAHLVRTVLLLLLALLTGCASSTRETPQQREENARVLLDQTTRNFHLPSADARGAERDRLLAEAASGYERLLRQYPGQSHLCAQALRSLGNVRASQDRLDDAVKLYAAVAHKYPGEDWEIVSSWKSAADLLAEAGRMPDAKPFYEKILGRFDKPDAPAVIKSIVRGSRARLAQ